MLRLGLKSSLSMTQHINRADADREIQPDWKQPRTERAQTGRPEEVNWHRFRCRRVAALGWFCTQSRFDPHQRLGFA
jgi:hypothetical protein